MSGDAKAWYTPISTRSDALKVVKDSSAAFFVLAAIQGGLGLLVGGLLWIDALVYAIAAFFLRRNNSRIAAAVLLLVALMAAGTTVGNRLGLALGGGTNVFLALIALAAGIKAVEATWKLHGRFAQGGQGAGTGGASLVQTSALRRFLVIGGYLVTLTVMALALAAISVSESCLSAGSCSDSDDMMSGLLVIGWIAGALAAGVLGWRGHLFGARARPLKVYERFVVHSLDGE